MSPKGKSNKDNVKNIDPEDVFMQMDRSTAEEIKRLSSQTKMNTKKFTQLLVFLGTMVMGRRINIEDDKKVLQISLEQYPKVAPLLDPEDE